MLEWLQGTPYSDWVQTSWGWPLALTIHAFGNAVVVGLVLIIGLRVFGFFGSLPYPSLRKFFPFIWFAVCCQFVSGFTLWMSKPPKYVKDYVFDIKFTLVLIGVTLTIYFQKTIRQQADQWQADGAVSSRGVKLAAAACITWAFVIIMGRLTAYLGSLYHPS